MILIDEVDAKVEVNALIAQNVLILLCDAGHLVAPTERKNLREACIEPHPLKDRIEGDEVSEECLIGFGRSR